MYIIVALTKPEKVVWLIKTSQSSAFCRHSTESRTESVRETHTNRCSNKYSINANTHRGVAYEKTQSERNDTHSHSVRNYLSRVRF